MSKGQSSRLKALQVTVEDVAVRREAATGRAADTVARSAGQERSNPGAPSGGRRVCTRTECAAGREEDALPPCPHCPVRSTSSERSGDRVVGASPNITSTGRGSLSCDVAVTPRRSGGSTTAANTETRAQAERKYMQRRPQPALWAGASQETQ